MLRFVWPPCCTLSIYFLVAELSSIAGVDAWAPTPTSSFESFPMHHHRDVSQEKSRKHYRSRHDSRDENSPKEKKRKSKSKHGKKSSRKKSKSEHRSGGEEEHRHAGKSGKDDGAPRRGDGDEHSSSEYEVPCGSGKCTCLFIGMTVTPSKLFRVLHFVTTSERELATDKSQMSFSFIHRTRTPPTMLKKLCDSRSSHLLHPRRIGEP